MVAVMFLARLNTLSSARQMKRYEIGEAAGQTFWCVPAPFYMLPLESFRLAATL